MKDFLEQLAELEVRDPPPQFDRSLHDRVNRWLLVQHLVDLFLGAIPWAMMHFLGAVIGFVRLSATGRFEKKQDQNGDANE